MRTKINVISIILTLSILVISTLVGCDNQPPDYIYSRPADIDDGLESGNIYDVGIDVNTLGYGIDRIRNGKNGEVHSLLVYNRGKIVVEEYFQGHDYKWDGPNHHGTLVNWHVDRRHNVASVGKGITSACIGIAIEQGFIESVDQSIFDYLPEHQHLKTAEKEQITIEHLLTMTSGLQWDEWGTTLANEINDLVALWDCDDPVACILERPMVSKPGTEYIYSGGNMIVLGEIIQNATGMDIESFSWEYLFGPMGIEEIPAWDWMNDTGVIYAGGNQVLTPREMMKVGVTYLNNGVWNGQQIIPEEWVFLSSEPFGNNTGIKVPGADGGRMGYGYTWWLWDTKHNGETLNTYNAIGWGGQQITVIPELDTVIVFTGGNYTSITHNFNTLERYILPAMK